MSNEKINIKHITQLDNQFYPTPREIAVKMLDGIEWDKIENILEPSAGKGNLIEMVGEIAFTAQEIDGYKLHRKEKIIVDCVEIDPCLRQILKYHFSDDFKNIIYEEMSDALKKRKGKENDDYFSVSESDYTPFYRGLDNTEMHIVHDNFLTFKPYKIYDLIVMNPPFKDGDKHLLHAIKIQHNGGQIRCVLNAETILNLCTHTRKELKKQLELYNAEIEFFNDGFKNAERPANVDIAIIKIDIPKKEEKSSIFEKLEKAAEQEDFTQGCTELAVNDYIESAIRAFNIECRAGTILIKEWQAMKPLILDELDENKSYRKPILELTLNGKDVSINKYLQSVRLKYWKGLFNNEKFMKNLTTKIREKYYNQIMDLKDYDFSVFNIERIMLEMNSQIISGVENEIMGLFDKLTMQYTYYDECKNNVHYYNGWKTNKAHKIEKKSIIPTYCMDSVWGGINYTMKGFLSDIEKVFDYLSGNMTRQPLKYDVFNVIERANKDKQTKNVGFTYFDVDFYKKGTIHIKFTCPELIDRLNIYVAQRNNWLPPCYGKKKYKDMTDEEKSVVNDFHKLEKETDYKKCENRYNEVINNVGFYIESPVKIVPMLENNVN